MRNGVLGVMFSSIKQLQCYHFPANTASTTQICSVLSYPPLLFLQVFAPHIVSYLEKEEATLREELDDALERETWLNENCTEVSCFVEVVLSDSYHL